MRKTWNDDKIIIDIKMIINKIGYFPSRIDLIKENRTDLISTISKHGGVNKFRKLLGYAFLHKPVGYWSDEVIINEIKLIILDIGHFPSYNELKNIHKEYMISVIRRNGGINYFRELMGYEPLYKPEGYWTDEVIIKELKNIIQEIGHFPTPKDLTRINRSDLHHAIQRNGGINKFRILMSHDYIRKPEGYWTEETTKTELQKVIDVIGHFPITKELREMNKKDLEGSIYKYGGLNKFRKLMGYDLFKKPNGFWTDEIIIQELKIIIGQIGHFPSQNELLIMHRHDLMRAIASHGTYSKYRELLGYTVSMHEKYLSELISYVGRRGRNSEKIVKKIIQEYCHLHNLTPPSYNVKLSKGNIIEFVCNTGKRIGIDVTNTVHKDIVSDKWTKKDYYNYLDELWVVVFSDVFNSNNYKKWNNSSPFNVKIFPIHQFLEELDYSLDEHTKSKIDKYCSCTFHTKDEFIKSKLLTINKNTYTILPNTKYNLCII